ncbi:MAG: hypothetical protein V4591_11430, partial [Bdellovibrionota bacterium]
RAVLDAQEIGNACYGLQKIKDENLIKEFGNKLGISTLSSENLLTEIEGYITRVGNFSLMGKVYILSSLIDTDKDAVLTRLVNLTKKEEDGKTCYDFHGMRHEAGELLLREILLKKQTSLPFTLITGKGIHSNSVSFMYKFRQSLEKILDENELKYEVNPRNLGAIIVTRNY